MKQRALPAFEKFAGLDADAQPLRLPIDEETGAITASVADDVTLDQTTGEIVRSAGSSLLSPTAVPDGPCRGLTEYIGPAGERTLIARSRSGYYRLDDARSTWTLMHAAALRDGGLFVPSFAQLGRYLVVVDGEQALWWDGEADHWRQWRSGGMGAPRYVGAVKTNIAQSAGDPAPFVYPNAYSFFYTFFDSAGGAESPPSRILTLRPTSANASSQATLATGYAKIGAGATADGKRGAGHGLLVVPAGATHVRVYRTVPPDTQTFYRVSDAALTGAAVAADPMGGALDLVVTAATVEESAAGRFEGPPAGVTGVTEHVQRLFVAGSPQFPDRLWWTFPGELSFSPTQWLTVGEASDRIVRTVSLPLETATLAILGRNSVWTLAGYDETTFVGGLRCVARGPGCSAPHAVAEVGGTIYFWNHAGIWTFDGTVVEPVHKGVLNTFKGAIRGE